MGRTNSIGTNTSCVGAVQALPTGYCTPRAITYVTTITVNAQAEKWRTEGASTANAAAATTKVAAPAVSVMSRRRAWSPSACRSRPRRRRLWAAGVS